MTTSPEPIYTMGRTDVETQRLIRQASLYNDITKLMLADAGITTGMKVLDIGTGAGDVALLAAAQVGPTGSVVGIDTNPDILTTARERASAAGLTNVTFIEGEVQSVAIDHDFDAAVGRLVLMYSTNVVQALRSVAERVRAGGVVAFQEIDIGPLYGYLAASSMPLIEQCWTWLIAAFKSTGANPSIGSCLYSAYREAGLGEPHVALHAAMGGDADWAGYRLAADTMRSILPILVEYGIATAEEVGIETAAERLREEVARTSRPAMLAPFVVAWARKGVLPAVV